MLDLTTCDSDVLDPLRAVISDLLTRSPELDTEQIMIVGASCRDILHSAQGLDFKLRETNDLDIGIALSTWTTYNEVVSTLDKAGTNGIRYRIAGIPVDLLPFGEVEEPSGTVAPQTRPDGLNVHGFTDIFEKAQRFELVPSLIVKVPTIAGYTALKMEAWSDRSLDGNFKDGTDLATAIYWYNESAVVQERLYGTDEGNRILIEHEMDTWRAAAHLLGKDAAGELGPKSANELKERWLQSRLDLIPTYLVDEHLPGWPREASRRADLGAALERGAFIF